MRRLSAGLRVGLTLAILGGCGAVGSPAGAGARGTGSVPANAGAGGVGERPRPAIDAASSPGGCSTTASGGDTIGAIPAEPLFVPVGGMGRTDLAKAYDIQPLYDQYGLDGSGQTVAIFSYDTFAQADIDAFGAATGISGPPIQSRKLPGGPTSPGEGSIEVILDIETVRRIAPQATIIDYEACFNSQYDDIVNAIVDDARASVISISWGLCEFDRIRGSASAGWQTMGADDKAFLRAASAGISTFVASGDSGAYGCARDPSRVAGHERDRDFSVSADYPGTSPYVTAVGGTYLSVATDGTYIREAGWEDPLQQSGGGGGKSLAFTRPDWQTGMGLQTDPGGMRQVPDVSGPADPDSGMSVVMAAECSAGVTPPCWQTAQIGGTSAAAPFWAGIAALAGQMATQQGLGPLGPLAPRLYRLANSSAYAALFHDVSIGGDLRDPALPGWDYSTGWGSPQVTPLVLALMDDLRANPTVVPGT